MAMKRVPLLVLVLLGAAATFPGVAIAEEEVDSRCEVQMCADGLASGSQCRSTWVDGGNCRDRCNALGCDGGSQVGDSFGCVPGSSYKPFMICECDSCGGDGPPDDGDTGGGGDDGGGCSDCLCDDWACDDNCWWAGYDGGECYLGECWCYANND